MLATLVGGTLAAGSANTLNCYLDRDIDQVMHRTGRRPLVDRRGHARARRSSSGVVLGVVSVAWLGRDDQLAVRRARARSRSRSTCCVYTMLLKRRTPQNIVWGGAAGCMPVLIGWSAVTGSLAWAPVVLFAVVFFWTPPHYWPLSMRFRDDYAAAGVPMLPVGRRRRRRSAGRSCAYSWVMVATSLLLWPVAGTGLVLRRQPRCCSVRAFLVEAHRLLAPGRGGAAPGDRARRRCGCSTARSPT